jgi:hypothetical protein
MGNLLATQRPQAGDITITIERPTRSYAAEPIRCIPQIINRGAALLFLRQAS